jgi:hypothetical protein
LIEVAVSLAIGGALAAASAVIAVQCVRARQAAAATIERRWSELRTTRQFEQDVSYTLRGKDDSARLVSKPAEADVLIELATLTPAPSGASPFPRRLPAVVRYRVRPSQSQSNTRSLVRELRFLTDVQQEFWQEVIADGLESVAVSFHYDGGWKPTLPVEGRKADVEAVRLELVRQGQSEPLVRTVVLDLQPRPES